MRITFENFNLSKRSGHVFTNYESTIVLKKSRTKRLFCEINSWIQFFISIEEFYLVLKEKKSPKGAMKGVGYFFRIFLGRFFGGIFLEKLFERNFFGRNYLVKLTRI